MPNAVRRKLEKPMTSPRSEPVKTPQGAVSHRRSIHSPTRANPTIVAKNSNPMLVWRSHAGGPSFLVSSLMKNGAWTQTDSSVAPTKAIVHDAGMDGKGLGTKGARDGRM